MLPYFMDFIDELYQDLILDHFQNPRCRRCINNAQAEAHVFNPLCGDEVRVMLNSDGSRVADISFVGNGCAISQASASMMGELVNGRSLDEIKELYGRVTDLIKGIDANKLENDKDLGDTVALGGVRKFPARVKCAVLAWEALGQCIDALESAKKDKAA